MTEPDRDGVQGWPLVWPLGLRKRQLTLCGTLIPTNSEIDRLFEAAKGRANEIFADIGPVEVHMRSSAIVRDWKPQSLTSEQIDLISRQLDERCRDVED